MICELNHFIFVFSIRFMKVLEKMKTKLEKIQGRRFDPQSQELFDDLEDVRSKFKQVTLKVQL